MLKGWAVCCTFVSQITVKKTDGWIQQCKIWTVKSPTLGRELFFLACDGASSFSLPWKTRLLYCTVKNKQWKYCVLLTRVDLDSAVNMIPVIICVQLLTVTYAYKLEPQLSNHSPGIFKVSTGSEQVTLVRKRYLQDAASGSLLPLNAFNFSLVWQAPGVHTDIHDLSSPVDVGGFVCVCLFVCWGII